MSIFTLQFQRNSPIILGKICINNNVERNDFIQFSQHYVFYHIMYLCVFISSGCILFLPIIFLVLNVVVAYVRFIICCDDDAFVKNMSSIVPEQ